ncbi:prepilin peptidase, partial [Patescibacteria group bacterium]|nr:prepilin peptidase [Patescibacteria group bacterium]
LGAGFASAITCAAMRMADGKSWVKGRSVCNACHKELHWHQLIPIFSFIIYRGRCSQCGAKVHWGYFCIELLAALCAILIAKEFLENGDILILIRSSIIVFFAVFSLVLDAYKKLVSVWLTLALTLMLVLVPFDVNLQNVLLGTAVGASFFLLQYFLTRGKGIGLGDTYLGAAMGAALGFPLIIPGILVGYIIGMPHALYLLVKGKANAKTQLSLGMYLMLGLLLVYFTQDYFYKFFL